MSKYSDHTTVGGQVLAHRVRMMKQNWNIVRIIGRAGFLLSFVCYLLFKWQINDIWNYLCIAKAVYRNGMTTLPSSLFSSSYFWFRSGNWREISDYTIASDKSFAVIKAQFETSLWFGLKLALCIGIASMVIMIFINKFFGKSLSDSKELLSGHDYVVGTKIKKYIKEKSDITLASIPYPKGTESRHTIITGTTGSGKTNIMIELLDQITAKNEKTVIVDTVGTFIDRYYREDRDIILNPFSKHHVLWSFLGECSSKEDAAALEDVLIRNVAECLIESKDSHHDFWDKAARVVFIETAKKAVKEKKTTAAFLDILLKIPLEEIEKYLEGTYGQSLMDKRADKMAISVRTTLINAISVFDVLGEADADNFSIKDWIASDKNSILFLSCKPVERASLIPLITSWLSIATESLLHTHHSSKRTWFFIDELHNLGRLPKIETSLAEIRKYGGCFVVGTQMVSQLNTIYGRELSKTITGLCGTKIVMGIPEPDTAKYMSGFLGEKEEVSASEAISYGANTMRDGVNITQKTETKLTVPYSEIMNLKIGEAFIKFSGINIVTKTEFKLHEAQKGVTDKINDFLFCKKAEQKQTLDTIISINDYLASARYTDNDLPFYGIPLSTGVISRPIYFFDKDLSKISDFLQMARTKNIKIIVFEDSSNLYDACFKNNSDILLNHQHENGCNWNIPAEYQNNFPELIKNIIKLIGFTGNEAEITKQYLFKMFSNINDITYASTADLLNTIIFKSLRDVASDLEEILNLSSDSNFEKYSNIREKLCMYLYFLKPNKNTQSEISIREYVNDSDNGTLFLSDFNNAGSEKLSGLIVDLHCPKDVLCLFSSVKVFRATGNSIIDGTKIKTRPESSIICSAEFLQEESLKTIFHQTLSPEFKDSYFAKICGNENIVKI
ncbi:MAG: type IV secretion system DNA-binding domain-containing protein [Holosporaceae bacterium]|jgi:type IV conjugative transfer system coupling protein TraD|nr:type IV secretion system DNA-binding domain-containing protein [Holosporaceae bacterium]